MLPGLQFRRRILAGFFSLPWLQWPGILASLREYGPPKVAREEMACHDAIKCHLGYFQPRSIRRGTEMSRVKTCRVSRAASKRISLQEASQRIQYSSCSLGNADSMSRVKICRVLRAASKGISRCKKQVNGSNMALTRSATQTRLKGGSKETSLLASETRTPSLNRAVSLDLGPCIPQIADDDAHGYLHSVNLLDARQCRRRQHPQCQPFGQP